MRFNRGSIHFRSNEFELALQDFDAFISIDRHAAGPYFNRGAAKDALGDRQGAIQDIRRFIEISGNDEVKKTVQKLLKQWESGSENNQYGNSNS